jgi:hypothetical protein
VRPYLEYCRHKVPLKQALLARDVEAINLMHQSHYPMSSAAVKNDWDMVQRLVTYGCDPNVGPSFMERPLPVSVMWGRLEEAEFLLRNRATRDLGDQLDSLQEAVRRRNIAEAQAVLKRPRFLRTATAETKQQTLKRKFLEMHKVFQANSRRCSISQEFKDFGARLDSHRSLWRSGMTGVRRLIKKRTPKDLQQVVGILCVASAMHESIPSEESFGSYDLFVEDLNRWRQLAILPHQQELFDEITSAIWGKRESPTKTPYILDEQSKDRNRLFQIVLDLVDRFSVESSLPLSILESVEDFWDYDHPSDSASITFFQSRSSHNVEGQSLDIPHDVSSVEPTANQSQDATFMDPPEYSEWKPGLAVFLMMGAIFACIISFMFGMSSINPVLFILTYIV